MKNFGAQDMVSSLKKILMKKPQKFMSKVDSQKWNYIKPLDQNLINKNYNDFYKIIKNSGAEIFELRLEDENEELCDCIFTHDPSLVLNEGAIILNMGKQLRKKEAFAHKNYYDSINIPIIGKIINEGTVEGGDCLWINNKTLLVGETYRTNKAGLEQLHEILKFLNIKLIHIKLAKNTNKDSCFHLMSAISMLDHDLAIGCERLLPSELKNILKKNGVELLCIPEDEYFASSTLAVNILALSPRNLVTIQGYPKTLELLLKSKCKINLFSGNELCIKAEGGPTCLTRPIWRN